MGKSGTHGIDMLIHWWGRFFGMAQWHCMTLSLSMSHTPCVQGFCFQHVRMHLLIWQLRKYLQWSRKPGSNQCSEYTFCHQTIGKTSVCCSNGHHQKAENICQFGWSIEVIHFDAVWKISGFCHLCLWTAEAPSTRTAGRCCLSRPKISPCVLGRCFVGEMLTWGYVAAITACARGQQWEETLNSDSWCTIFFRFKWYFFQKMIKYRLWILLSKHQLWTPIFCCFGRCLSEAICLDLLSQALDQSLESQLVGDVAGNKVGSRN